MLLLSSPPFSVTPVCVYPSCAASQHMNVFLFTRYMYVRGVSAYIVFLGHAACLRVIFYTILYSVARVFSAR